MMVVTKFALLLLLVACYAEVEGAPSSGDTFKLIVLHNNDMHARFEQTNALSGKCPHKLMVQNKCFGGFPRVAHIVNEIKSKEENVIFLNAGDTYQGTVWYTVHKWPVVAKFIQMIGLDAMVS
jgi:2',3'-cyclic-nucleotide 2'-phosphodiesterase (5'-nucleotidase family)